MALHNNPKMSCLGLFGDTGLFYSRKKICTIIEEEGSINAASKKIGITSVYLHGFYKKYIKGQSFEPACIKSKPIKDGEDKVKKSIT
jgi:hypothetical protein